MTPEPVRRLVVATDFSDTAERALGVGIRFAKLMGATLDLVHVYFLPSPGVLSPMPGVVPAPPPGPDELKTIEQRPIEGSLERSRVRFPRWLNHRRDS